MEEDAGVAQLREVFVACDVGRTGRLGVEGLELLCRKLQLSHRLPMLVRHLLGHPGRDSTATVSFDEFKEAFISLLTQAEEEALSNLPPPLAVEGDDEMNGNLETATSRKDREVSPKYVLGEKKYGRRSRPASQADADVELSSEDDLSVDEVLCQDADTSKSDTTVKADCDPSGAKEATEEAAGAATSMAMDTPAGDFMADDFPATAFSLSTDAPKGPLRPAVSFGFDPSLSPLANHSGIVVVGGGGGGSESAESSLTLLETNPEEYLRATWRKLNVGRSGYLQVEELAGVCEFIGMEMNEEMICQLFHTLDSDQDGKVSFEEFLQGMFQHGRAPNSRSVTPPPLNSSSLLTAPTPSPTTPSTRASDSMPGNITSSAIHHRQHHTYRRGRTTTGFKDAAAADNEMSDQLVTGTAVPVWESGIFSSVDPDNTGYAESQTIVALWESLGLSGGSRILKQLGFNPNLKVNLQDLSSQLEEELSSASTSGSTYAFALASHQHELQHLKINFEQAREERDRLRVNVSEANTRAALIAQEVDEHHAKLERASESRLSTLEKRHQEQLRELQEELQREREATTLQLSKLKQRSQEELASLRNEEARLRAQLAALEQDNRRLELELQEYSERYSELHRYGETQQKELENVTHLKQRIADLESGQAVLNDEHCQKMFHEVESTRKQNKELKDSFDELSLELETLRQQLSASSGSRSGHSKRHRRSGSWVSDYSRPGAAGGGLKRRGSEGSSSDESDDDNPVAGKIRRRAGFPPSTGLEETHCLALDVGELTEPQREVLERLRAQFEQALREAEERWRLHVFELESQLSSQPEVDKDSIDGAQSAIAKLQDELSMRNVLTERLRADVTSLQNQLAQQKEQFDSQLALRDQEAAQLAEQKRTLEEQVARLQQALVDADKRLAEQSAQRAESHETDRKRLSQELDAKRKELEDLKSSMRGRDTCGSPGNGSVRKGRQQSIEAMYESKLAEVRNQVEQDLVRKVRTDVERELQTSLEQNLKLQPTWRDTDRSKKPEDLTAQLTEDICVLLRDCLRCAGASESVKRGSGDSVSGDTGSPHSTTSGTSLQEQLASLIGKTLAAIENHLETLHLQEHERLRKTWEDQVRQIKQDHMIERLECELQHKGELTRLRSQPSGHTTESGVPSKTETLLRDLYVENARLLRSLQRAEDGRRRAEHNSTRLQYKCRVLSKLLTDVTRAAVDGSSRVACA